MSVVKRNLKLVTAFSYLVYNDIMPHFVDSVDKIVQVYFSSVTLKTFTYKGKTYEPKTLHVSPNIMRGFTCPAGCGGCCPRFSLDYLPFETRPDTTVLRKVKINEEEVPIYSDMQMEHDDHFCKNLIKTDGRCGIYLHRPFSCDFELIRFFQSEESTRLSQQLFGRGWQFLRIDDKRGAMCEMTPVDPETIKETIRKLNRLESWASYFGLTTKVHDIVTWIEDHAAGKLGTPLKLTL